MCVRAWSSHMYAQCAHVCVYVCVCVCGIVCTCAHGGVHLACVYVFVCLCVCEQSHMRTKIYI